MGQGKKGDNLAAVMNKQEGRSAGKGGREGKSAGLKNMGSGEQGKGRTEHGKAKGDWET